MTYKAVIFDLDGTLVNTLRDIAESVNFALRKYQLPTHPVESYRLKVGDGNKVLVQRSLPPDQQHLAESILKLQMNYYAEHFCDYTQPYPQIPDLLTELKELGLKLAVLSNKPDRFMLPLIDKMFIKGTFDRIQGQTEGIPLKPDPAFALAIAFDLQVPPTRIVYVGDTGVDMRTANRAEMYAVGAAWGFRDRDELLQNGCQAIIEEPMQLISLLQNES
jgi:phosphoglycolate phosphatase